MVCLFCRWLTMLGMLFLLLSGMAQAEEQRYIVRMETEPVSLFSGEESPLKPLVPEHKLYTITESQLALLADMPGVLHIEPEMEVTLASTPDDPLFTSQWNLRMIQMPDAYLWRTRGEGVRVGVIDSGAMVTHPDLINRIAEKENFSGYGTESDVTDQVKHGTIVAGIIAAETDNGIGISGVSAADLVILKALHGSTGGTAPLIEALYAAVDEYGCDVINMSLGLPVDSTEIRLAVEHAIASGAILVAASGNTTDGHTPANRIRYPAGYEFVVGVGSVDEFQTHVSTSVANQSVDVCAPGQQIYATLTNGLWGDTQPGSTTPLSGTSFATPHVAGAAAIVRGINPNLTSAQFHALIEQNSADCGEKGRDDRYGYGLLNIQALTEAVAKEQKMVQLSAGFTDENGNLMANFRNFSENTLQGELLWGVYHPWTGILLKLYHKTDFTVASGEVGTLAFPETISRNFRSKLMLFQDLNSLSPIVK